MKRRLLVARALLNQPKLLALDEPTTGLDPQARHLVWHRLRALKAQGVTQVLLDSRIFSTGPRALRISS
jgi:lipooligosaccharide transport system ATP-binding protein